MEKTLKFKIIKFVDITIKRQKFHQYKDPFQQAIQMLIKQQYLRRSLLTKINNENFKYFISYKDIKILDLYSYFFQKWVHVEEILIKLNV